MHLSRPPLGFRPLRHFSLAALAVLLASLAGLRPAAAQGPDMPEADKKALQEYKLTLDKVDKVNAVSKKLVAAAKSDPQISKEMQAVDAEKGATFDQVDAVFGKQAPHVVAIIKGEGLEPHDYILGLLSTMFASMGASMKASGAGDGLPDFIPAANIELAEKNKDKFEEAAKNIGCAGFRGQAGGGMSGIAAGGDRETMTMRFPALLAVCGWALCVTLAGPRPAAAQSSAFSESDKTALADYHLTREKLDKIGAITRKFAEAARTEPQIDREMRTINGFSGSNGGMFNDFGPEFGQQAPHIAAIISEQGMEARRILPRRDRCFRGWSRSPDKERTPRPDFAVDGACGERRIDGRKSALVRGVHEEHGRPRGPGRRQSQVIFRRKRPHGHRRQ